MTRKTTNLAEIAGKIKKLAISVAYKTHSHHLGSVLSCLDILTALYFSAMNIDPKNPKKPNRDWFILSKGHAALALYTTLAERGYFDPELLKKFGADGSGLGGHPDKDCLPGVEASTGSLGHGLSVGAGVAWLAKKEKRGNRVFVLLGDGECNEGSVWETAAFAGHHGLDNLVAVVDRNRLQGFGSTDEILKMNLTDRWSAFGWSVKKINGHNLAEIAENLNQLPISPAKPNVFIAETIKGRGIAEWENKLESHYLTLGEEQYKRAISEL